MNFEDMAIGWREALIGVVALLVLYVFVVFLRLRRLKQPVAAAPVSSSPVVAGEPPVGVNDPTAPVELPGFVEPGFPWNEPPDPVSPADIADARLKAAEAEIGQMRAEMAVLRNELATLRDDLKVKVEHVRAAQHVAPIYGDAMQMAVAGYDAAAIAERCGVARAEAELVVALVRNREGSASAESAESTELPAAIMRNMRTMRER
ncbi:MAG: hypothetical protein QG619_2401 [Pseudomonadota bacterium]|nr:hypothetical protein [Pseudomonadota bacterium]